jgi:hypothetical protein
MAGEKNFGKIEVPVREILAPMSITALIQTSKVFPFL